MDSASLLGQLQTAQNSAPSASDLYNSAVTKYGVPEIRSQVSGLRTTLANTNAAINNVAPSVAARSQGSLVTGGQQSALANLERQPLDKAYGEQNTSLTNRTADLNDLLNQATGEANLGYKAGQDKISGLQSLYTLTAQKEQAARDEAFRQQQLAEQVRASKASANSGLDLSSLLGAATSNASATGVIPQATQKDIERDVGRAFQNIQNQPAFYTEQTIIPAIANEYYGGDKAKAATVVYAMRKKLGLG